MKNTETRNFNVEDYIDYATKNNENYIDSTTGLVICTADKHVVSSIHYENKVAVSASYCFSDGSFASDELEDDLQGVLDFWEATGK